MARKVENSYFGTKEEAEADAAKWRAEWGGAWNPYDGRAYVTSPNDDRPTWKVEKTRNDSAE